MNNDNIEIIGASVNNLKHINISIPKGKLIVLAGVSGSGKTSLAFDTIATESSREWQSTYPLYLRNRMPHYERPNVESINNLTPTIVVDQKSIGANARSTVGTSSDIAPLIRLLFSRIGVPSAGGASCYSFNHPKGMCPDCTGLGSKLQLDEESLFNTEKTIKEGGINFSQFTSGWQSVLYQNNPLIPQDKPIKKFTKEELNLLKYAEKGSMNVKMVFNNIGQVHDEPYEGVIPRFLRLYVNRDISKLKQKLQDEIKSHIAYLPCNTCHGTGLNPKALESKINGYNIEDFYQIPVIELLEILKTINNPIGISISNQIIDSLERMIEVGLGYLTLSRKTDTLSGGELQRLKMVRHLGSSLTNITYIFDEPTAGLHPDDAQKIINILFKLRDKHNTIIVVEHSKRMIELADYIIELGPLAGVNGGQVIFKGTPQELLKSNTKTSLALKEKLTINTNPKESNEYYTIQNACLHNLKDITVNIPKNTLTAVCGVAGSGKSSLIRYEFLNQYKDAIVIDQKPIGISSRSNIATYTGIMDEIRHLFSITNNIGPEYFSFNSKGACPACNGRGETKPEVAFADSISIPCEECHGSGFNKEVLKYLYNGKNIEEVMNLTVDEALNFFDNKKIITKLDSLHNVGLGYMTLGQTTNTFSGGENQRLKLASHLTKKGNTYILDEPSNGLHHEDIKKLLNLFIDMVAKGNTVIIIEHRLELIAASDYIIELGPLGGSLGGELIFTGTPQELLQSNTITSKYIKKEL